jgi:hypothetical protein
MSECGREAKRLGSREALRHEGEKKRGWGGEKVRS